MTAMVDDLSIQGMQENINWCKCVFSRHSIIAQWWRNDDTGIPNDLIRAPLEAVLAQKDASSSDNVGVPVGIDCWARL